MRVILDGFDGSFLPILQSFKAVMPGLRITGIEELGQSANEAPSKDEGSADAINVSELFTRQDERDELLPDGSLFLRDDKFNESGEFTFCFSALRLRVSSKSTVLLRLWLNLL